MSSYVGISNKNPTKYLGPDVQLVSIVSRNRSPTSADIRQGSTGQYYPLGSEWLVSKDPTTGTQGDKWYLSKIVGNVATWLQYDSGVVDVASFAVDAFTPPGTNPVVPTAGGLVTITGAQVAAGTIGADVIRTDSLAANEYTIEIQRSAATAASDTTANGVAHFSSAQFNVGAGGFVTLLGGGQAIDSFLPDSGTSPVVPSVAGAVSVIGSGSTTTVGGLNSITIQLTGLTDHAVLVGAGTTTITKIAATANTGAVLQNNSGADPSYSTATYPSTTTINQLLYSSANNTVSEIVTANNAILTTNGSGVPSWTTNTYVSNTSFTPVLSFGGGTTGITYSVQQGYYTRIGNTVFVHIWILLTSKGTDVGTAVISGLPFTIKNQTSYEPMFSGAFGAFTNLAGVTPDISYNMVHALGLANTTTLVLIVSGPTLANTASIADNNFTNTTEMTFSGFYDV